MEWGPLIVIDYVEIRFYFNTYKKNQNNYQISIKYAKYKISIRTEWQIFVNMKCKICFIFGKLL